MDDQDDVIHDIAVDEKNILLLLYINNDSPSAEYINNIDK